MAMRESILFQMESSVEFIETSPPTEYTLASVPFRQVERESDSILVWESTLEKSHSILESVLAKSHSILVDMDEAFCRLPGVCAISVWPDLEQVVFPRKGVLKAGGLKISPLDDEVT